MATKKTIPPAWGYAVLHCGQIIVATVSPTERAAKVNGLTVIYGLPVYARARDDEIEATWRAIESRDPTVEVLPIEVALR